MVGALDGGIEQDLAAVNVQAQAKLDVFDAGLAGSLRRGWWFNRLRNRLTTSWVAGRSS